MSLYGEMQLVYTHRPLSKIDKRCSLAVVLFVVGVTFALRTYPSYAAGLAAAVILLAGVYRAPELGIAVLVNGLYLAGFFWRGMQIPYIITPLAVVLSSVGLTHYVFNHSIRWRFGILPSLVVLIGLMLFLGLSYSPLPSEGLIRAGKYLSMNFFIFFATMLFTGDLNRQENLMGAIALIGMVATAASIVYIACTGTGSITRFALPGQNPIWFARGMGMSVFATLFLLDQTCSKRVKLVCLASIPFMVFLLYSAASRGPFLAFLITLLFYFFVLQKGRFGLFRKVLFFLLIVAFLGISVTIAPQHIWDRMFSLVSGFDITTFLRLRAFETAKTLFFENPLTGVGTGGFGHFNVLGYPHNIFLEFASELGIFGLSAISVFVLYAAYLATRLVRATVSSFRELSLSRTYFALLVFSLVNSQFSGAAWSNYELWFAVAGIWVLYAGRREVLQR